MIRAALGAMTLLFLSACDQFQASNEYVYKIVREEKVEQSDKSEYESLRTQAFTRNRQIKILAQSENAREFHFLAGRVIQKVGSKTVNNGDVFIPMRDGVYVLDCRHYYSDVPLGADLTGIADPECDIELIGAFVPNGRTAIVKQ